MTKLIKWVIALVFGGLLLPKGQAQELSGVITYQTKTTIDISRFNRGGEQMSEQRKKQIMERMKNFLEKEYTLTFTKNESFYKEEEALAAPTSGGGRGGFGGSFVQGGIYKNVKENAYARENNMFGKVFLVKDTLNNLDWELVKESKMIGDYPVFKAVATRPIEANLWSRMGRRGRGGNRGVDATKDSTTTAGTETVQEETPKTETIVAWYTPMIPASHGPDDFGGLPGLILQLNTKNTTIVCTKVLLNPQDEIVIEAPTKGKEVTREEYANTIEEKAKEMAKRFGGNRSRGGRGGRFGG